MKPDIGLVTLDVRGLLARQRRGTSVRASSRAGRRETSPVADPDLELGGGGGGGLDFLALLAFFSSVISSFCPK